MTTSLRPTLTALLLALNLFAPYALADTPVPSFAATREIANEDELTILNAVKPTTLAEGIYYFHFNGAQLLASEPGQRVAANVEIDHPVSLVVLGNELNFGDFRRLTGYIESDDVTTAEPDTFSMTLSPNGEEIVGNFTLHGSNFGFEGIHGVGWVKSLYRESQLLEKN